MEDFSKIREEQNRRMSFEEYNNKNADKVKEKKFGKAMKAIALYPIKFVGAIFGITKESLLSSSSRSSNGHAGAYHNSSNNFKQSYRVDTPQRTHEDMVREHIAHDAYMDMVDGKGDNER